MVTVRIKNLVDNSVIIGRDNMNKIEPIVLKANSAPVILDFEGIEIISSPFAHSLVKHLNMHTSVSLKNASPHVMRMIEVIKSRSRSKSARKAKNVGRVVIKASKEPRTLMVRLTKATR